MRHTLIFLIMKTPRFEKLKELLLNSVRQFHCLYQFGLLREMFQLKGFVFFMASLTTAHEMELLYMCCTLFYPHFPKIPSDIFDIFWKPLQNFK